MISHAPPFVLFANGAAGGRALQSFEQAGTLPVAIVLNSPAKQRDAALLQSIAATNSIELLEWREGSRTRLRHLFESTPEAWIVSIYFGHLIPPDLLAAAGGRALNLHPAMLPWCRGVHTNVWPIVERCPAGVSLHVMTERLDDGPIIAQREVPVAPSDTAASLYAKLEDAAVALISEWWPDQAVSIFPGNSPSPGGSYHALKDFAALSDFDVDADPSVRRFVDLLRARTFPPHPGARIRIDGQWVHATIHLEPEKPTSE